MDTEILSNILFDVESAVGGHHSTSMFSAEDVIEIVRESIKTVTGDKINGR